MTIPHILCYSWVALCCATLGRTVLCCAGSIYRSLCLHYWVPDVSECSSMLQRSSICSSCGSMRWTMPCVLCCIVLAVQTTLAFLHIPCTKLAQHAVPGREKYMRFGLEGGKSVILDRVQANTDTPIILKQHAITFDRSADLQRATNNHVAEQPGDSAAGMLCLLVICLTAWVLHTKSFLASGWMLAVHACTSAEMLLVIKLELLETDPELRSIFCHMLLGTETLRLCRCTNN